MTKTQYCTLPQRTVYFSLFLILSLFFLVQFQTSAQAKTNFPDNTILAPGDTIQLQLKKHPLLNNLAGNYVISPVGNITIAEIGDIHAAGESVVDLKNQIQQALRSIISIDPKINLSLLEQNRFILMGDGVRYPGWYKVQPSASIEELIDIASGLRPGASIVDARISRIIAGKSKELPFANALPLQSFDRLTLTTETDSAIVDNGDLLYVIIPKEVTGEFSPTERNYFKEKVEVDRHGFIFLPSQGNIKISGYTTEKISELLTNNLPKYLSKSDKASVNLIEKRHYIQILGHVANPGWYNIPESANIQAILGQAGGTLEGANLEEVTISRKVKSESINLLADIQYYLSKGDNRMLPVLHENDTVFVPLAPIRETEQVTNDSQPALDTPKIRIFGAVNSPGIYPAPKGLNFLDLLITAQGETAEADLTKIKIMRANGEIEIFNMQALLETTASAQETAFPQINGGDIVHVVRREPNAGMINTQTGQIIPQTITMTGPGSNSQGLQPFNAPMTPFQAIAQAGGMNDFADTNDIMIIRRVDGKQESLPYNYDNALKGKAPDVDFQLQAGDMIYIP
ncbi:MAG: SLBB domain-containing protein [Proteobacteria bacterium]|nr:SLBB domain-containing protein [Pseudomonadota bacterium]